LREEHWLKFSTQLVIIVPPLQSLQTDFSHSIHCCGNSSLQQRDLTSLWLTLHNVLSPKRTFPLRKQSKAIELVMSEHGVRVRGMKVGSFPTKNPISLRQMGHISQARWITSTLIHENCRPSSGFKINYLRTQYFS